MKSEVPSITTVIDTNDSDSQRKSSRAMPTLLSSIHSMWWHVMAGKTKSLGPAAFDTEIDIRGAAWPADENKRKQYDAVLANANFAGIFRFACSNYLGEVNPAFFFTRPGLAGFS